MHILCALDAVSFGKSTSLLNDNNTPVAVCSVYCVSVVRLVTYLASGHGAEQCLLTSLFQFCIICKHSVPEFHVLCPCLGPVPGEYKCLVDEENDAANGFIKQFTVSWKTICTPILCGCPSTLSLHEIDKLIHTYANGKEYNH